jgi:hypothetical protein
MIRRSTVVYIVLLLGLVGAYLYLRDRPQAANIELTAQPSSEVAYLFPAEQGTPSNIRIESKAGKTVEVRRGADKTWGLIQPIETKADQASAEAAASQVSAIRVLDTVPEVDPKIVGLDDPQYVLTIKFDSGLERTAEIGVITPTQSGYYARDAQGKVVVVDRDSIDSLLGLLDNPPYQETLTPGPVSPTEASTPVPTTAQAGTSPSETATP